MNPRSLHHSGPLFHSDVGRVTELYAPRATVMRIAARTIDGKELNMMKLTSFGHINIVVDDIDKATQFYQGSLGAIPVQDIAISRILVLPGLLDSWVQRNVVLRSRAGETRHRLPPHQ